MRKHNMTHNDWVRGQFTLLKRRGPSYRNVLLLTSFIETVIRYEASKKCKERKEFKQSLEVLRLTIDHGNERKSSHQQNCQYKTDCLIEINLVRVQRNQLLHDIIKESLPKKHIEDTIRDMKKNIEQICTNSDLIRKYFRDKYGFDPAKLVK